MLKCAVSGGLTEAPHTPLTGTRRVYFGDLFAFDFGLGGFMIGPTRGVNSVVKFSSIVTVWLPR